MSDNRPNPDALLAEVTAAERQSQRGKLKIFFGAAAGVGKTYAMLEAARKRAAEGMDVLIGYAEPHIRTETEALLLGLEIQPYKMVEYKGAQFKEFDLDKVLARKPALVCVDELAHTNIPGTPPPRHAKRFQDVQDLLDAGINVYTTLNVQHLESVNDIVERTSGIKVRETLPDWVLEQADDVQLIDTPPDALLERIFEGKIYKQHAASDITKHFFNKGNLSALRELALRRTADRVDAQMEAFRKENAIEQSWPAADRTLVCVGPSPFSARLVRSARRMSMALKTQWIAAYVETPSAAALPAEAKDRVHQTLRLAEQLGGQTVTLSGANPAAEILAYARSKNVARIITGKPHPTTWAWFSAFFRPTFVDQLIRQSGPIDIYVIRDDSAPSSSPHHAFPLPKSPSLTPFFYAAFIVAVTTAMGWFLYHVLGHAQHFSNTNVIMLDLLGVLLVSMRFGRGPAVFASVLAVGLFDFTVVPPYYSFAVSDAQYFITFAVMLLTALVISTLADRINLQAQAARQRERRTAALLELSKDLSAKRGREALLAAAAAHISETFFVPALILLPDKSGHLASPLPPPQTIISPNLSEKELSVAQWSFDHREPAGLSTQTLPSARGLYLPLIAAGVSIGVLSLFPEDPAPFGNPDHMRLLEAFANQAALALERIILAEEAQRALARAETELIRNTLLSAVSHDLRTPLAVITGAATSLLESPNLPHAARIDLLSNIADESERMERLITNLLDMTRLESGSLEPKKELFPLQELVISALERLKKRIALRTISMEIPNDLPLLSLDGLLFEQVLVNLIDNALEYTPANSPLIIKARSDGKNVTIEIADSGPGLPPEEPNRVFQKFFRSPTGANRRGLGLGLSIAKGIVELHGGTISAENRPEGGALFRITLPAQTNAGITD